MTLNELVEIADNSIPYYHPLSLKAIAISRFLSMKSQQRKRDEEITQRVIPSTVVFEYSIINGYRDDVIDDYTPTEDLPPPEDVTYEDPELADLADFINN